MSAASTGPAAPTSVFDPRLRASTLAILTATALASFEGLAVAAALPQVAADLGDVALLPWVLTTFLLVAGIATIIAGSLVDRVGVARTFWWSIVLFTAGGVAAGFAPSMELLIAARVLQGLGGGATQAVSLAAVGLVYPRPLVGRALAANATLWGVMSIAGPGIAAGLLLVADWRWIFLVNLPIGLVALWLGRGVLPTEPAADVDEPTRIDPVTLVLLSVFSIGALLALDRLSAWSLVAAGVALLAGWVLMRRTAGDPTALVAPRHVLQAPLGPLAWTIALLLVGGIGSQLYVPLYVAAGRGVSATLAAWSVMFFTLGWTLGANLSSRLMDRRSPLSVTTAGTVLAAPACFAVAATSAVDAPLWVVFAALVVAGVSMGTSTNSALTLVRVVADDAELGRATAAHAYVRSQGFAGGSALAGALLLLVVATRTGDVEAVRTLLEGGAEASATGADVGQAVRDGFTVAAAGCGAVALLAHVPLRAVRRAVQR